MTEIETLVAPGLSSVAEGAARPGRRSKRALISGVVLLAAIIAVSVLLPLFSPYGANQINGSLSLHAPSWQHPVGTDSFGRDILVRMCGGFRISLLVSVGSVVLGALAGIPLGLLAAVFGNSGQMLIMRPLDVLMSFPTIVLAIIVSAILGNGTLILTVAIAVAVVPRGSAKSGGGALTCSFVV